MARPRTFDSDLVLEKASEAFRAKGYEGTSIDDLEKATGLGRASLYGAYGDKRSLHLAALRRYEAARGVRMLAEMNGARSGRVALERLFAGAAEEAAGDPCGCLMTNAASERSAHDEGVAGCAADHRRRVEGAISAAILRGREDGSVKGRGDVRASGRLLFTVLLGIRTLAKTGCGRAELREVARGALKTLD